MVVASGLVALLLADARAVTNLVVLTSLIMVLTGLMVVLTSLIMVLTSLIMVLTGLIMVLTGQLVLTGPPRINGRRTKDRRVYQQRRREPGGVTTH
jgi:hypothetical protein